MMRKSQLKVIILISIHKTWPKSEILDSSIYFFSDIYVIHWFKQFLCFILFIFFELHFFIITHFINFFIFNLIIFAVFGSYLSHYCHIH